jgi:hypothetical protein
MDLRKAVRLAIDNLAKEGLDDIFPRPFEVDYLSRAEFRKTLERQIIDALQSYNLQTLRVHPIHHVLFPKKEAFDFRRAALIDPIDSAKYLTLVLLVATNIERRRIAKTRKVAFSYRFAPRGGYLFDPKYTFTAFENHAKKRGRSPRVKVLVKCDIANFYDRLNLHRLESILLSLSLDERVVKLINELLLFWAGRDSYGLPIGSNASRILAEASLM